MACKWKTYFALCTIYSQLINQHAYDISVQIMLY